MTDPKDALIAELREELANALNRAECAEAELREMRKELEQHDATGASAVQSNRPNS
jgi:hypothetical protein